MATSDDDLDLRDRRVGDEGGGRRGGPRLASRLRRRRRGGGTDVAERPAGMAGPAGGPEAEAMPGPTEEATAEPVSRSAAEAWFSLVEPVEYDEWGDPVVKGVPRGPGTVNLRRTYFPGEDESSP